MSPKLWGTRCLVASTGTMPVESYKFFSSVGAFMGAAAQANYAIANSCLDSSADLLGSMGMLGKDNPLVNKRICWIISSKHWGGVAHYTVWKEPVGAP